MKGPGKNPRQRGPQSSRKMGSPGTSPGSPSPIRRDVPMFAQRILATLKGSHTSGDGSQPSADFIPFFRNHHTQIFVVALVLCGVFSLLTLFLYVQSQQEREELEATGLTQARTIANKVGDHISNELTRLQGIIDTTVVELNEGTLKPAQVTERLRNETEAHSDIFGLGVAFEPGYYKVDVPLYAPYYAKDLDTGDFRRVQIEESYDYTDRNNPDASWYTTNITRSAGYWQDPYFGKVAQTWVAEYISPFMVDGKPGGVLYIDHSFDTLSEFMKVLDLGENGYSFILSRDGKFVVHPDEKFVGETIYHQAEVLGDQSIVTYGERALAGESFVVEIVEPLTNQPSWVFYRPIPMSGWSIGVVVDKSVLAIDPDMIRRNMITIALTGMLALFFLGIILFRVHWGSVLGLWLLSSWTAILFIACIGYIWHLEARYPPRSSSEIVLVNQSVLNQQLDAAFDKFEKENLEKPIVVPTGIMLETITFGNANENSVSGYVWQKYPKDMPDDIDKGFFFSDSLGAPVDIFQELYRLEEGNYEIICWFFYATMRQEPSVEKYPLDQATVQIQFWPKSFDKNVILVPDLDGYKFINPTLKPGLVDVLVLEDWYINRSYFSYRFDKYNAYMGSERLIRKDFVPELYFNVIISRYILSPFIAYAITLLVVMALTFAVMAIHAESSFNVLSYTAALFFVVAVSHVGLRAELQAAHVVYLEHAFIIMYVVLLAVSVNSILFYSDITLPLLQYKSNLIPKLLYWPLTIGVLLWVTLLFFYPENPATDLAEKAKQLSTPSLSGWVDRIVSTDVFSPTTGDEHTDVTPTSGDDQFARPSVPPVPDSPSVESPVRPGVPPPVPPGVSPRVPPGVPQPPISPTLKVTETVSPSARLEPESGIVAPVESPVVLRYGIPDVVQPFSFDPMQAMNPSITQISNLFVGLTDMEASGQITTALATDWSISDDGLEWTFRLRDDIPWVSYDPKTMTAKHVTNFEGQPRFVSATDVAYGIKRMLTASDYSEFLYVIDGAKAFHQGTNESLGIDVVDDTTIRFRLEHPAPYFPFLLAHPIASPVPEWTIAEWGDEWIQPGSITTNGPYMLARWTPDEQIRLVKNPLWVAADAVQIDVIDMIIRDERVVVRMFADGQIDTISDGVSPEGLRTILNDPELRDAFVSTPAMRTVYYGFNHVTPPFNDARIRRAFSAAVDRQALIDDVLKAGEEPATTFAPPGVFGAVESDDAGQGYDPDLARSLLQEYLDEKEMTLEEFQATYDVLLWDDPGSLLAQRVIAMWKEILGIEVHFADIPKDVDETRLDDDAYSIAIDEWWADYPDQNNFLYLDFHSEDGLNWVRRRCTLPVCESLPEAEEFDRLTAEAAHTRDPRERETMYARAENILAVDEAAYIPLYHGVHYALTQPYVIRNYSPLWVVDFDQWDVEQGTE